MSNEWIRPSNGCLWCPTPLTKERTTPSTPIRTHSDSVLWSIPISPEESFIISYFSCGDLKESLGEPEIVSNGRVRRRPKNIKGRPSCTDTVTSPRQFTRIPRRIFHARTGAARRPRFTQKPERISENPLVLWCPNIESEMTFQSGWWLGGGGRGRGGGGMGKEGGGGGGGGGGGFTNDQPAECSNCRALMIFPHREFSSRLFLVAILFLSAARKRTKERKRRKGSEREGETERERGKEGREGREEVLE